MTLDYTNLVNRAFARNLEYSKSTKGVKITYKFEEF